MTSDDSELSLTFVGVDIDGLAIVGHGMLAPPYNVLNAANVAAVAF